MPHRLDGKVALITGGTSGIGEATVELFIAEGAKVVLVGRNADKGAEIAKKLGPAAHFFAADVTREQDIKAAIDETVAKFGRLDALFNNAGGRTGGDVASITQDDFSHAMNLLLGSVLFGIRYAAPIMTAQGGGSIISNASVAAYRSHMGGYLYSIAKAAVVHAARIAAVQLGVHNIRVNTISPGSIATPIFLGGSDIAADMDGAKVDAKMEKLAGNLAKATPCTPRAFPSISPMAPSTWPATTAALLPATTWSSTAACWPAAEPISKTCAPARPPEGWPTLSSVAGRWIAGDDLLKTNRLGVRISQPLVKTLGVGVIGPDEQLHFPDAPRPQPKLGGVHHLTRDAAPLHVGMGGDIVDPAAMTVFADHGGGDHAMIDQTDQHPALWAFPRESDVCQRIIPRARNARRGPEFDHLGNVRILNLADH